jgi:hypothetical protein
MATAFPANQPCRICSIPLPICTQRCFFRAGPLWCDSCRHRAPCSGRERDCAKGYRIGLAWRERLGYAHRARRGPPPQLAAREHDFLTSDLSHRALQARGMGLSTPDFMRQCLRGVGTVFRAHRRGALLARPHETHPARSKARSACAIDRGQRQSKALFRTDAVGLSRYWRRSAGRRGSGDAWRGWLAAGRPDRRRELRGSHGRRLRRDARRTWRKF